MIASKKTFNNFASQSAFKMKNQKEQLQQITEIKNMMERSSRFISLSGLSGVFAGFSALAGALAFYIYSDQQISFGYSSLAKSFPVQVHLNLLRFSIIDAFIVLVASLSFGVFFTTRKAKADGLRIWDRKAMQMLVHLFIPLFVGGVFCLILLSHGLFGLVAPSSLIFYGLALYNASKFTLDEIKYLGFSEIILGLISSCFLGYGLTFWAIGFGVLHIIYGLIMYIKYEATPKENKFW